VDGGNGDDHLIVNVRFNVVNGGNGADTIEVATTSNIVDGGNGDDRLLVDGRFNVVNGGNGADDITSFSSGGLSDFGQGNVLTGGRDKDSFTIGNTSDLVVINDLAHAGNVGVVGNRDIIRGVFDEITDYTAGELLAIGGIHALAGPVALSATPNHVPPALEPAHKHLVLGDGEYAFLRGNLTAPGQFTVDSGTGHDLFVVFDRADGDDQPFIQGAVALLGVTDPSSVLIG